MVKLIKDSHVTIMVSDMGKAINFYTKKLGFKLSANYDNKWVEISAPGMLIGLHRDKGREKNVCGNPSIGFEVEDFKKTVKKFEKKDLKFDVVDEDIIMLGYFKDPDGTLLYLWEYI